MPPCRLPPPFIPKGGDILIADFGPDPSDPNTFPLMSGPVGVVPEIYKERHAVVLSTPAPGMAIVAPFSTIEPRPLRPFHFEVPAGRYAFFSRHCWLKGDLLQAVSLNRLDRIFYNGRHQRAPLSSADLEGVRAAIMHALGLGQLVGAAHLIPV